MNELVQSGMSYRDAYKAIGNQVNAGTFAYKPSALQHTHLGSIGNPGFLQIRQGMQQVAALFR
jgi:argininosuccinate lyase